MEYWVAAQIIDPNSNSSRDHYIHLCVHAIWKGMDFLLLQAMCKKQERLVLKQNMYFCIFVESFFFLDRLPRVATGLREEKTLNSKPSSNGLEFVRVSCPTPFETPFLLRLQYTWCTYDTTVHRILKNSQFIQLLTSHSLSLIHFSYFRSFFLSFFFCFSLIVFSRSLFFSL